MFTIHSTFRLTMVAALSFFILGCASSLRLTEVINVPNEKWRIIVDFDIISKNAEVVS